MKKKTYTRRRAIRHIAETKQCSFAVAAHTIDCMSTNNRVRLYRRFNDDHSSDAIERVKELNKKEDYCLACGGGLSLSRHDD